VQWGQPRAASGRCVSSVGRTSTGRQRRSMRRASSANDPLEGCGVAPSSTEPGEAVPIRGSDGPDLRGQGHRRVCVHALPRRGHRSQRRQPYELARTFHLPRAPSGCPSTSPPKGPVCSAPLIPDETFHSASPNSVTHWSAVRSTSPVGETTMPACCRSSVSRESRLHS
jgi:hypothetical protein